MMWVMSFLISGGLDRPVHVNLNAAVGALGGVTRLEGDDPRRRKMRRALASDDLASFAQINSPVRLDAATKRHHSIWQMDATWSQLMFLRLRRLTGPP